MKRLFSMLMAICFVWLVIPALAENADQPLSDISGTDWLSPETGYIGRWEGDTLLLNPVDQEGNRLYIDDIDLVSEISADGDAWRIQLELTQYPDQTPVLYRIPVVMTEERYRELSGRMNGKDKKKFNAYKKFSYDLFRYKEDAEKLVAEFPALATEQLYILISAVPGNGPVSRDSKASVEQILAKYGYTEEDFEKDLANVAVWPTIIERLRNECRFPRAVSDSSLTRSRVLELAALSNTISNNVIADYLRPDGKPVPVEDLIMETYQVNDTVWHVTRGSVEEDSDRIVLTVTAIPE